MKKIIEGIMKVGIGNICLIISAILTILKVTKLVSISWWLATLPLWIIPLYWSILGVLGVLLLLGLSQSYDRKRIVEV